MTDIEKHQHELNQVGHDFGKKREPYWDYMMRRMREEDAKEKAALDKANEQLFYQGVNTTIVRFGYFDSPRVEFIDAKKMSIDYCVGIIGWVLRQPHRVKDITVVP